MSHKYNKKLQWYKRVTKQGEQLLNRWKFDVDMHTLSTCDPTLGKSLNQTPSFISERKENTAVHSGSPFLQNFTKHSQQADSEAVQKKCLFKEPLKNRTINVGTAMAGKSTGAQKTGIKTRGKPGDVGELSKLETLDNDSAKDHPVDGTCGEKKLILKNGRKKNFWMPSEFLGKQSALSFKGFFKTANPPNLMSAMAKTKWVCEGAKALRDPMLEGDLLTSTPVMDPYGYQEEMWFSGRVMGRNNGEKDPLSTDLNAINESDSEPMQFSILSPEKPTTLPQPNRMNRARTGRSIKRRRRDLKTAAALRADSESVTPLSSEPSLSPGKFIIPDVPFDISEGLSMEVIDAAYDFIHNG